jgi:hypothetical protein
VQLLKNGVMAVRCEPGCEKCKVCLSVCFVLVKRDQISTGLRGLTLIFFLI